MPRRTGLLALCIFVAALVAIIASGRQRGDFRIDEVHKISETFFLRLIERGDLRHPAWMDSPVERSNPPVGKMLFGLALQAAQEPLPADLTVAQLTAGGRRLPPAAMDAQYRRWLGPARLVSAMATSATVALVFLAGAFATDLAGGLICATFYALNFLVITFAATAVFDPLLTFFVLLAGVLALRVRDERVAGVAAALASALAFNVRVTGLVAIGSCLLIFLLQRRLRALAWSSLLFPAAAVILNPYYWVPGPTSDNLPQRIVSRMLLQQNDLRTLLQREIAAQGALDTIGGKMTFLFQYALGDWTGVLLLIGILCLIAAAVLARHRSPQAIAVAFWSATIAIVITLWIPIAFPRYLLVAVPPIALLGGIGWRFAAMGIAEVVRNSSHSARAKG